MIKVEDKIIVEIEGVGNVVTSVDKTIYDLMKEQNLENEVIAVIIDNDITELSTKLKEDTKMKLIKIKDRMGAKIYRSGLKIPIHHCSQRTIWKKHKCRITSQPR